MLTLRLTVDEAILLRDILMAQLQGLRPESRPDVQEILDAINTYLEVKLGKR